MQAGKEQKMWGYMNNYGWGGMGFGMGLGMLLLWGLLIAGIVMLVRFISGSGSSGKNRQEKTALDLLKERYARGEIGQEEFEKTRREIER
jgi:putative membrane protein